MILKFKIKRNLIKHNKEILKIFNKNYYYKIDSIKFILDNENNLYFIINDNEKNLFYNYKLINNELYNYLFSKYQYLIEIDIFNINSTNIKLNECNIIYLNKFNSNDKKEIEKLKKDIEKTLKEILKI